MPSKLSERILFGSTASASDAKSLKALGVTHIVSLVNDPAFTVPPNTPPFRHLRVRAGGVARERLLWHDGAGTACLTIDANYRAGVAKAIRAQPQQTQTKRSGRAQT